MNKYIYLGNDKIAGPFTMLHPDSFEKSYCTESNGMRYRDQYQINLDREHKERFKKHVASLPQIEVVKGHDWQDQQILVEGKDFKFMHRAGKLSMRTGEITAQPRVAVPILKPNPLLNSNSVEQFQTRVNLWMMQCFGEVIANDKVERNHRFLEEALELVQSLGCSKEEAYQLVDYVYARPKGEPYQEVGGVMVTLAALCLANGLSISDEGEKELARIWTKIEKIREKQAAKPKHSPLPAMPNSDKILSPEEILKKYYDFDEGFTNYEKNCVLAAMQEYALQFKGQDLPKEFSREELIEFIQWVNDEGFERNIYQKDYWQVALETGSGAISNLIIKTTTQLVDLYLNSKKNICGRK